MISRLLRWAVLLFFVVCVAWYFSRPVIALHYSADAKEPVVYFYIDEDSYTIRGYLAPGQIERFYTPMFPDPTGFPIDVSAPFSSRDGVEIKPPFSRVDVYIDAEAKFRVQKKYGFFDRF